ncbi:protein kinase domain-containing protein [Citrus sinensis]|uniref:Protein kinase domain-containing protein n=1 Tax=Citrus sinensis TaxID=2711 RepID=A0ACB8MEV6_CITSI|nr:protein kinase domain-containing protein [Citrus sinensis]
MLLTAPDCFSSSHLPFASIKNSTAAVILKRFRLNSVSQTRTSRRLCRASLITSPDSFEVGRLIGSYGFMNITSYSGLRDIEYSSGDLGRLGVQDVGEGSVKIRLYEGRIAQGPLKGTSVMFKVYPGQRTGGIEADMMAANELNAHAFLQSSSKGLCQNLVVLVGGFETKTGEQWLAFRSDGKYSAADYAKLTSEKISKNHSAGESSWNRFETEQILKCRRYFVIKLFQGAMSGLAYMHDHDRLHQSLGPSSVILKYVVAFTIVEKDAAYLVPRLRDLSFSVDISFQNLEEDPGTFSEGLWRRAAAAGAFTPMEKRAFGIADDVYEAGLLLAYLAFVTFCEANVMDSLSLQRLLESTFRLDLQATREYCLADDRLLEAVKFLDLGEGAGWELLQAMLNPDFQQRPIAEAVINHRFTAGAVL